MPIEVTWYNAKEKILLWTVGESWTIEEYYEAFAQTKALMKDVEQPAYAVVDATELLSRPRMGLMSHFIKVLREVELELLIYVRRNDSPPIIQKLLSLIVQSSQGLKVKRLQFATSMIEAMDQITRATV